MDIRKWSLATASQLFADTFTDVAVLEKACQRIEHLGLTLPEAKQILGVWEQWNRAPA